jgi:hypothetical protein
VSAPSGKWVKQTRQHQNGEDYVLGKVTVGSASYNALRSREDPLAYRAFIILPGIQLKAGTADFATIEEAKARVEAAVSTWFKWVQS